MKNSHDSYSGGRALVNRMITECRRLQDLFDISYQLNAILDREKLRDRILDIAMSRTSAVSGLLLVRATGNLFELREKKGLKQPEKLAGPVDIPDFPAGSVLIRSNRKKSSPVDGGWRGSLAAAGIAAVIPMTASNRPLALLCLGLRRGGHSYDNTLRDYLETMATTAAIALTNSLAVDEIRRLNSELDRKISEQESVFTIATQIAAHFEIPRIMESMSSAIRDGLGIELFSLCLEGKKGLVLETVSGISEESLSKRVDFEKTMIEMRRLNRTVHISDEKEHAVFNQLVEAGFTAVLPLRTGAEVTGFLCVGKKRGEAVPGNKRPGDEKFPGGASPSPDDLIFLETIGSQVAAALENADLFRQAVEKERILEDLHIAAGIQEKLLPTGLPSMKHFDISAHTRSCQEVGGDYLDFLELEQNRVLVAIGDVTGKGVPAALLMSNLQAGLHILAEESINLGTAASRLNNLITKNTEPERFVTFFFGILDDEDGSLEYINAGHNPPLLLRKDGAVEELREGGIILGVLENIEYSIGRIRLRRKDVLVMYTDGVSESADSEGLEFGSEGITETVAAFRDESAARIREVVEDAVFRHSAGRPLEDDITLAVIKREKR